MSIDDRKRKHSDIEEDLDGKRIKTYSNELNEFYSLYIKYKKLDDNIERKKFFTKKLEDLLYDCDKIYEPLEDPDLSRFTINQISNEHDILYRLYKKQKECYWVEEEITYDRDKDDFNSLSDDEKHFIKQILAFFAGSDGLVNFNISNQLLKRITNVEARLNYGFQFDMENTHGIVYSKLLENIVKDKKEYDYLLKAIENISTIKKMSNWALKWTNGNYSLGQIIVGYAIVEGLFFSGAFASIYWLKKGKNELFMRGLVKANEFIARDEGMHTNFAVLLYKFIVNRLSNETINEMFNEAVEINKEFICDSISCKMIGMDIKSMSQYIEYVADRLLTYLGYKKIYNSTNPFPFMETIGLNNRNNFFESRTTDYPKAHTTSNNADWKFKIDDNF